MPAARKYRIKDIRTGQYLPGAYTSGQVRQICGMRHDVSGYASRGSVYCERWKVEYADDDAELIEKNVLGWESEWCMEWDKARLKLLKAYGKA